MIDAANQELDLRLIGSIRRGDTGAKERLIAKYTPMVRHIAARHYASFLERDDLVQEGLIGLLGAIAEYKPESYAVKFSSFAYLCIIRKMYNAIKQAGGNKHRALNEALSLSVSTSRDPRGRSLGETLGDAEQAAHDPEVAALNAWSGRRLDAVLRAHLSALEYAVVVRIIAGCSAREIERELGVEAKSIDNARTRIKTKLDRLIQAHGSLTGPAVPLEARRRRDLYADVGALPLPVGYLAVESPPW
ncbi:MAG TPA: sigma-70 family RNA polymerase sigma factor [Limnochordia bacterium]|nr:sigma-70 family RNA polymerase sigma factor [Limnochordia bacterium]